MSRESSLDAIGRRGKNGGNLFFRLALLKGTSILINFLHTYMRGHSSSQGSFERAYVEVTYGVCRDVYIYICIDRYRYIGLGSCC